MARCVRRFLCAAFIGGQFVAPAAFAYSFDTLALISSTLGDNPGRVCVGDAEPDIGCPTNAPYLTSGGLLGIGTTNPQTALEVSGTVSATHFVGDGAGLTGLATSGDRITSGTTSMVAVSATGYVSLTQAGSNTGWFDPTRGLVTLGISSTGTISGTTGYFSNNVGIGGNSRYGFSLAITSNTQPTVFFDLSGIANAYVGLLSTGTMYMTNQTSGKSIYFATSNTARVAIDSSGNMGVGILSPAATLQVSGSFIVSTTGQNTTPSLYVGADGKIGIGTTLASSSLHIGSSGAIVRLNANNVNAGYYGVNDGSGNQVFSLTRQVLNGSLSDLLISGYNGIAFQSGAAGTMNPANTKVYISSGGNLGVNTLSPSVPLDVSGAFKISGDGSEACLTANKGTFRVNPSTGRVQLCH